MTNKGFGFQNRAHEKLGDKEKITEKTLSELASMVKPRTEKLAISTEKSDEIAHNAGFVSRQIAEVRPKSRVLVSPTVQLNLRVTPNDRERFIYFAEKYNLSLPKALGRILDLVDCLENSSKVDANIFNDK